METVLKIFILFLCIGCNPPTTNLGVSAARGDRGTAADDVKVRVVAKNKSFVIFIFNSDSTVSQIPLDSLLKYYSRDIKKTDDGNHE